MHMMHAPTDGKLKKAPPNQATVELKEHFANLGRTYVLRALYCEFMQIASIAEGGLAAIAFLDRLPSLWEWPPAAKNKQKALPGPSNSAATTLDITQTLDDEDLSEASIGCALEALDDDEKGSIVPTWQTMTAEEWNTHTTSMMKRLKSISHKMDKVNSKPAGGLRKSNQ